MHTIKKMKYTPTKIRLGALDGMPAPWGAGVVVQLHEKKSTINLWAVCAVLNFGGSVQFGHLLGERLKPKIQQ